MSWIDSLLHFENYKLCTAGKLPKELLTIPSIIRRAQYDNLKSFIERVMPDKGFVKKWYEVEKIHINRKRKTNKKLSKLDNINDQEEKAAA